MELQRSRLLNIWQKLSTTHSIPLRSHKYKLKVYPDTFLGEDLIQWLFENEGMVDRQGAVDLAQALVDGDLVTDSANLFQKGALSGVFSKSAPYKLKQGIKHKLNPEEDIEEISETSSEEIAENDDLAPEWLQDIEQRANVEMPTKNRVELKVNEASHLKMSSPANHQDLSQFLNKFPSGTYCTGSECFHMSRCKSLLESWVTTFLPD